GDHAGRVIVRIHGARRKSVGADRAIGRERSRDHFINAYPRAAERAIDAVHKSRGVGEVATTSQGALFQGAAHFAGANNLVAVRHTATEFIFDFVSIGASRNKRGSYSENDKKRQGLTHRFDSF